MKRVQAIVSGTVHGVGYRYWATHAARRLGVVGTVRNLPGGEVEAIAEGDEGLLTQFVAELRTGPSAATVRDVQEAWGDPSGSFQTFQIIG